MRKEKGHWSKEQLWCLGLTNLYCEYQQPEWKTHRAVREEMNCAVDASCIPEKKSQATVQINPELGWVLQPVSDRAHVKQGTYCSQLEET